MKLSKLALVIVVLVGTLACKSEQKKQAEIINIELSELNAMSNETQIVDVRTPEEYDEGYIKNAINMNVKSDDFAKMIANLDKSKAVVVYCMAGVRSTTAAEKLLEAGFTNIYNYKGGFGEWTSEEMPITKNK